MAVARGVVVLTFRGPTYLRMLTSSLSIYSHQTADRVMASINQDPSLLLRVIPCPRTVALLRTGQCRRYATALDVSARIRGTYVYANAPIMYEVEERDHSLKEEKFNHTKWRGYMYKEKTYYTPSTYQTPESVRNALLQTRHKYTMSPGWETFNFDSIVYVLAGMLAVMTQRPTTGTREFRNQDSYDLRGLNQVDAAISIGHSGTVYIDNLVAPRSNRNVYWAMVTAANVAGARVISPIVDCDGNGNALCNEISGGPLINGITGALSILGSLYSMAGLGDVYAFAYIKGLHSFLTVVSHSDEGGFMRDVIRSGTYMLPHGGIPTGLNYCPSVPVLEGLHLGSLCGMVDTILLTSAALVAHCDPMVEIEGNLFPTTYTVVPSELDRAGVPIDGLKLPTKMAKAICGGSAEFCRLYVKGLARLFGVTSNPDDDTARSQLALSMHIMSIGGSRHTDYEVTAPYFWIEPTGLIPQHFLGTAAELAGSGALVTVGGVATLPLLEDAERIGAADSTVSDWAISYKRARTTGFALLYQNHHNDGTAAVHLKGFDSSRIVMGRLSTEQIRDRKDEDGYVPLSDLMWTRGQSKVPHPAEAMNIDGRAAVSIFHSKVNAHGYTEPLTHLPREDEVQRVVVELRVGGVAYTGNAKSNHEPAEVKRLRNRGAVALNRMRDELTRSAQIYAPPALTSEVPPPRQTMRPKGLLSSHAPQEVKAEDAPKGSHYEADAAYIAGPHAEITGTIKASAGKAVPPARQHGVVIAPQPRDVVHLDLKGNADPSDKSGESSSSSATPLPATDADATSANKQAAAPAKDGVAGGK